MLPSILTSGDIVNYRYATQVLQETRCCFASESAAPFLTLWVYVTADYKVCISLQLSHLGVLD